MPTPSRIDVHQHLWTPSLLAALATRDRLPFVRRTDRMAILQCAGEQAWAIDLEAQAPGRRAALITSDGLDMALIALSSPIGIEALPRDDACELIDAHLTGTSELGHAFAAWGPIALDHPDAADVDGLIGRGCAGISVPSGGLAGRRALEHLGPVLERATQLDAPVFIHPGPAPGRPPPPLSLDQPLWWPALTDYVAQMQAAWLTFATVGRREHPRLRIVFAMLAGGAPLLSERLAVRGGPPVELRDPLTFFESSSYGPVAVEAMARRVGAGQIVFGSDRPVVEPSPTPYDDALKTNAAGLLTKVRPKSPAVAA